MVTNFAISNFLNTYILTFSFLFSFLNNYFSNDKELPTGNTAKILFILTKTIFHICVLSIHSGFKLLKYNGNSQVYDYLLLQKLLISWLKLWSPEISLFPSMERRPISTSDLLTHQQTVLIIIIDFFNFILLFRQLSPFPAVF